MVLHATFEAPTPAEHGCTVPRFAAALDAEVSAAVSAGCLYFKGRSVYACAAAAEGRATRREAVATPRAAARRRERRQRQGGGDAGQQQRPRWSYFASSAELPDSPSSPEEAAEDAAAEAAAADLARATTGRPNKAAPQAQAAPPTTLAARLSAAVDRIRAHVDGETTALTLKQTSGDL